MGNIWIDSVRQFNFHPSLELSFTLEQGVITLQSEELGIYLCGFDLDLIKEELNTDLIELYEEYVINDKPYLSEKGLEIKRFLSDRVYKK